MSWIHNTALTYLKVGASLCVCGAGLVQGYKENTVLLTIGGHTEKKYLPYWSNVLDHMKNSIPGDCFLKPVLRIRIPRIHMFLGLPDPYPDPLFRDTDPDPSFIKQK